MSREIRAANTFLRELCDVVVGAYGPHSRAAFSFLKVTEAIESLFQDLQTQASQDHPGPDSDNLYG